MSEETVQATEVEVKEKEMENSPFDWTAVSSRLGIDVAEWEKREAERARDQDFYDYIYGVETYYVDYLDKNGLGDPAAALQASIKAADTIKQWKTEQKKTYFAQFENAESNPA